MEWILRSPQMQSTFGNLAYVNADGYHINENCSAALQNILHCILTEDKYLRSYRRSISFGQNIQKDIVPLLLHTQDDKTVELLIKILVNLTIPIECLLSVDAIGKSDFGRHMIFEINNLLNSTKQGFVDQKVTKVLLEFLKKNFDFEQPAVRSLTPEQIENIANGLLLLRNILHIPEENSCSTSSHTVQNQIMWNIFSQSIDKVLIKLMNIPEATNWSVTMVQLIALLYKDQHVGSLHKLLNSWLEASFSESSEDNESNTTPPNRDTKGSDDSSPTWDLTSDSSDNCGSGSCQNSPDKNNWRKPQSGEPTAAPHSSPAPALPLPPPLPPPPPPPPLPVKRDKTDVDNPQTALISNAAKRKHDGAKTSTAFTEGGMQNQFNGTENKSVISNSDCGYGTQVDNQESVSTSSNEDEPRKPVHQKPHNPMQKPNTKVRLGLTIQDKKRKKIVKRAKANIINVRGLSRKTPNDEDISIVLKEFTVDFLLKGYNSLVRTLYTQILNNLQMEIDTSHFFWLVMYFLKFATQIDLELEHINSVLSFDIVAYLTAEGVNLCEQFELATKLDGNDLKPSVRRLHLVVTAIREIVQAIDMYKKVTQFSNDNKETLVKLQIKMCEMDELRSLMVLLLRHYDPKYHNKQYLQDLVVTNHILLVFVDNVLKLPDYKGNINMLNHIKQFATPEMMYQYGLLLEDYLDNGEFVNECVFTLMHHVGGEVGSVIALFQPIIIKTFTSIWQSEFEICDDWSDLIEYVINTFVKKPQSLRSATNYRLDTESFDDDLVFAKPRIKAHNNQGSNDAAKMRKPSINSSFNCEKWTESELSSLSWNYMQCNTSSDVIGDIVKIYKEEGATKSRESVINELYKQNIVNKGDFDSLLQSENNRTAKTSQQNTKNRDIDIAKLCEQLIQDGKCNFLEWVQQVLLDTCHAKIYLDKKSSDDTEETTKTSRDIKILSFGMFKKKHNDLPLISPVSYYNLLADISVPLVQWNFEHVSICKDLKFLQLLHKLGFQMPVDTGKVFIRIPHLWTADYLYEVAGKVLPIDTSKLNFCKNDLPKSGNTDSVHRQNFTLSAEYVKKDMTLIAMSDNFYQIQKQNHLATMVNYTPMPSTSYEYEREANNIGNATNPSWLEIVQRSQELKFTLNMENVIESLHVHTHEMNIIVPPTSTVVQPCKSTTMTDSFPAPVPPTMLPAMCPAMMPAMMPAMSPARPPFSLYSPTCPTRPAPAAEETMMMCDDEDEDNNSSACDTASVASDLTRMYVSDEDEKPKLPVSRVPVAISSAVYLQPRFPENLPLDYL